jgi:DNA repair photolyase
MNRLHDGYVCIKNPMNANQISKVALNPNVVDCIIFWSKNPEPIIKNLDSIDEMRYKYYFQFTITPYDNTLEPAVPDKRRITETFISLSEKIGKEKVIWRYDPIILNDKLTINFHVNAFEKMMSKLSDYTSECIISFVDPYKRTKRQMGNNFTRDITTIEMSKIAEAFSEIAKDTRVKLKTCAEIIDLDQYGIEHASCIDRFKIESIISCPLSDKVKKDGQREACGCMECIDVGAYNTCKNGCLYCYATFSRDATVNNCKRHNPKSPLLIGELTSSDKVSERKVITLKNILQTPRNLELLL